MVKAQPNTGGAPPQPPRLVELRAIFDSLPDEPLLARLRAYRPAAGRPSYPIRAMWRAYVASFVLNLANTNTLIRELRNNDRLRRLCGFRADLKLLPHRRTFNRFIRRLGDHHDLVEGVIVGVTNELKARLPDMGDVVAIDSTPVRTHSDPRRGTDPEAGWGVTHSSQSRGSNTKLVFGFKAHTLADANYGLPLTVIVTAGNRNDSPLLPPLVERAKGQYNWFAPKVAIADRGYDAASNHEALWHGHGIIPVIHMRKPSSQTNGLHNGVYTARGEPTCLGGVGMEYVGDDEKGRYMYQCRNEGCHLKETSSGGVRYCDSTYTQDPMENIRLFGVVRRAGPEWRQYYRKRMAVERLFKSMKQSRRLERHCVRGLRAVRLHALMACLTFQATALTHVKAGREANMRWMVERVA